MQRTVLLSCGILSSILYVAADVAGALAWPGYDPVSQAVSELTAAGAPTRSLLVVPFLIYDALLVAFGVGVMRSLPSRKLRLAGMLLVAVGGIGFVTTSVFPMRARGSIAASGDAMHIILTALTVACIAAAMMCAALALGGRFRWWSIAAAAAMLGFGALAGMQAPRIAAGLATPWLGLFERLCIGSYLLWTAGLASVLLGRHHGRADRAHGNQGMESGGRCPLDSL